MFRGHAFLWPLLLLTLPAVRAEDPGYRTEEVTITADDGEHLAATLWLPDEPGRHAAVLLAHGFGGRRQDMSDLAERYVHRGYATLTWDARGFGQSGGYVELNGPKEVADAVRIVSWLANRSEVRLDAEGDPRVAMVGASYGGSIQLLAAAIDPRLDALVPMITWNRLEHSLEPNGVLKFGWTTAFYTLGTNEGHGVSSQNPNAKGLSPEISRHFAESLAANELSPATRAFLAERSVARILDRVHAPVLLVQGWRDTLFTSNEAAWTYENLTTKGTPARLLLFNGGHGYEDFVLPAELDAVRARVDDWLRAWLEDAGSFDDLFQAPVEWWDARDRRWIPEQSWPVSDSVSQDFFLTLDENGQGRLVETRATQTTRALMGTGGLSSYSEVPGLQSRLPMSGQEAPVTSFPYRTDPFLTPTRFLGSPVLRLYATTSADSASIFVKIYDEDPAGGLRLLDNQTTPLRVLGGDPNLANPRPYEFELVDLHHTFEPSHRLRVTLATSDVAYSSGRTPGAVALVHGPEQPAHVQMDRTPLVRDSDAQAPQILDVRVAGSAVRARIVDDVGVAKAHLYFIAEPRRGASVGRPLGGDEFEFSPRLQQERPVEFHIAAADASGNGATSPWSAEVIGRGSPTPGEAPGLGLFAPLVVLGLISWRHRRGQGTKRP